MTRVLADMALDVAGATALSFRLSGGSFDKARDSDRSDAAYARIDDARHEILGAARSRRR
jgi:putative acyl-CoA dehydrogenase